MTSQHNSTSNYSVPLNQNWTYVSALVDCSGSMQSLNPTNTALQLQGLIREQKSFDDERVNVSVARFSDHGSYNLFIENKEAQDVTITAEDVRPGGCTALLESMARIINDTGSILSDMTTERPGKVVIIIFTDGEENASTGDYCGEDGRIRIAQMVKHQQDVYNWKFFFLGANIDAITVGQSMGFNAKNCINYISNEEGCTNVMRSTSAAVKRFRSSQNPNDCGFTDIERNASIKCQTNDISQPLAVNVSDTLNSSIFIPNHYSNQCGFSTFDKISEE